MSFREVQVHEIREVLRLWLRGEGERAIARLSLVDRKTVKRYVTAGVEAGLVRDGGEGQLTDGLIGQVCERVRPHRPDGHGAGWEALRADHEQLKAWLVDEGLTVVKAHELLARQGVKVPQRTLHRYALEVLGVGRSARAVDGAGRRWRAGGGVAGRLRQDGPDLRRGDRAAAGVLGVDLHRRVLPALLRVAVVLPDDRDGDRRVRGGVGVLRRGVQGGDPRQHVARW